MAGVTIAEARSAEDFAQARGLLREYEASLGVDLCFQSFEEEMATLETMYGAAAAGALLLALRGEEAVGCVGVRAFRGSTCEMKRLYVRPGARRTGAGRALAVEVMRKAAGLGYRRMVLDTLPSMETARALYRRLGFHSIPAYYGNPLPGVEYLAADLAGDPEAPVSKPDFSGEWRFLPDRSALQIPRPDSTSFVIDHREPSFRLERTHVAGGRSDTFAIELTTGGEPTVQRHGDLEIRARLYWEGDALVFDSTLSREGEQASNIVRYRLADEGRTFVAEERFRGRELSYDNTWVFERH